MFEVEMAPRATRDLDRIPPEYRQATIRRILALENWPNHGQDVVPMEGSPRGTYRLRVGKYRVIFAVVAAERRVLVLRVGDRKTIYS